MDNQKYLVIITILDGQNFALPDGAPDKIEATVFAEARFGKESTLRSDPIKLNNSNPEFVTELAWQLDRRSLHQLRVERKAIKLQVFMQTKERKKSSRNNDIDQSNGWLDESSDTHRIELIGYTILDLRSAQQKHQPRFQWLPLLNPKFRKSVYNRPEIQLAITLSRIDDEDGQGLVDQLASISTSFDQETKNESLELEASQQKSLDSENASNDSKLFTTCLETTTTNSDALQSDEIIDNDLIIRNRNGSHYVFDAKHPQKSTIDDCCEHYKMRLSVAFGSGLDELTINQYEKYHFLMRIFGVPYKTAHFRDLTFAKPPELEIDIRSTHSGALATYFELNSNLDIKLMSISGETIGIATIQLNQLCSLDMKCRSIEGIFALQSVNDNIDQEMISDSHPSIGVSIILERVLPTDSTVSLSGKNHMTLAKKHFGEDLDEYMFRTQNDTHQLTFDSTNTTTLEDADIHPMSNGINHNELVIDDQDRPSEDDHHFCFTIDLKKFMYTSDQRLIPTLRELVIRYSYPFFGYKDTITTDASIPINANSSIVVSGFCEFNFATSTEPLLTALNELPLNLEILAADESRLKEFVSDKNELVGTCDINLAKALGLNEDTISGLSDAPLSTTSVIPILGLKGEEVGHIQVYLSLKDLGRPPQKFRSSMESLSEHGIVARVPVSNSVSKELANDFTKLDIFISETKQNLEIWKEDYSNKLSDEVRQRDNERLKRLFQRVEAKEAKRDQEFRLKIDELSDLGKKFKNYLSCVENLEKMLSDSLEQLKVKNAILDSKLDLVDFKISQVATNSSSGRMINSNSNFINNKTSENKISGDLISSSPMTQPTRASHRSFDDDYDLDDKHNNIKPLHKSESEKTSPRRPSLQHPAVGGGGGPLVNACIPVPIRSSSLVRRSPPVDGCESGGGCGSSAITTTARLVKRTTCAPISITNGFNHKPRSNSTRLNLSKETQAKLISLRKEKAELLKRGCKPSDELIQEINSLIEKLVC